MMEEIQFLNYILSILAVLLSAGAFWLTSKAEERHSREIRELREKIKLVADRAESKKR